MSFTLVFYRSEHNKADHLVLLKPRTEEYKVIYEMNMVFIN